MMDSQHFASNSFELLDDRIKRWIWQQGWETLRSSQEEAIPAILGGDHDVVVSAPTSAGKTEAAFLPILTRLLAQPAASVRSLYIGPLKALINDQFSRLELLCEALNIPVHRWHGDVSQAAKTRLVKSPSGILLITPESLEALLMRQGNHASVIFSYLAYVVVDELHSYIGNERGAQLQSLLNRVERLVEREVPRIGLSATIADPDMAAAFLRPRQAMPYSITKERGTGEIRAQISGFYRSEASDIEVEESEDASATDAIVKYIDKSMGGSNNLVFCNSKRDVEELADALSESCRQTGRRDEYCAHHGNLSKEIREDVEARLKSREQPTTCVCTSTLEMGIDIGAMKSIAQFGPPPTVASLRQRVGRSGRRGDPAVLRMIAVETRPTPQTSLIGRLHLDLIRSAACLELMSEGWCEPPIDNAMHLSTLVQQCMSIIAQRGGAAVRLLYDILIGGGTFTRVSKDQFARLLKALGEKGLLEQMEDGTLLLGKRGERIAEHFSFYSAFATPEEYQLVGNGKAIGSMPITTPLRKGDPLLFAGKRWQVVEVDDARKVITLTHSRGKRPPRFLGDGARVDGEVRTRMYDLLCRPDVLAYMNAAAPEMLASARATFADHHLHERRIVSYGQETLLFHWGGDLQASTLRLMLCDKGLKLDPDPEVLGVNANFDDTVKALNEIVRTPPPSSADVASKVGNKQQEKHDWVLTEELLVDEYASRSIDIPGAISMARQLIGHDKSD